MEITRNIFGTLPDGREAILFSLKNDRGMEVDITNYGGIITALRIPDKHKMPGDIVLGFETLDEYLGDHPYFGALIGRYANRIAGGKFRLEGREYTLVKNNGLCHLHGGTVGFDKVLWTAAAERTLDSVTLKLGYQSPDMEEGYPGNMLVEVEYTLNDQNELVIAYRATSDKTTHVNLTNHSYFNLNNCRGDILDHVLMIDADRVTELDADSLPTGKILEVDNSCFDFRNAKPIGEEIEATPPGYDINYVVNDYDGELKRIATVYHEASGRVMDVLTTQPGVQLYTSNYVENIRGKEGVVYNKHAAVCLETQHYPDTPNHTSFPSTVLHPGETYHQVTIYRFKW
ncbi:MAG: galactose mutarotase [Bacteroidales bacterium]|nr:galactose mutarotase [Bacteroidales bacterium]MDT8432281.1 aldose epimerase family protein [Bacteroidales bacterium]